MHVKFKNNTIISTLYRLCCSIFIAVACRVGCEINTTSPDQSRTVNLRCRDISLLEVTPLINKWCTATIVADEIGNVFSTHSICLRLIRVWGTQTHPAAAFSIDAGYDSHAVGTLRRGQCRLFREGKPQTCLVSHENLTCVPAPVVFSIPPPRCRWFSVRPKTQCVTSFRSPRFDWCDQIVAKS